VDHTHQATGSGADGGGVLDDEGSYSVGEVLADTATIGELIIEDSLTLDPGDLDIGSANDVSIRRSAAGQIQIDATDATTTAAKVQLVAASGDAAILSVIIEGDTNERFVARGDATHTGVLFGPGNASVDTELARTGAGELSVHDTAGGGITFIVGDTDAGADLSDARLVIGIERSWSFFQGASGASTELILGPDVAGKTFKIMDDSTGSGNDVVQVVTEPGSSATTGQRLVASTGFAMTSLLSPAQITANTDNYSPTSWTRAIAVLRINTDASRNLTGIAGGYGGRVLLLCNVGAQNVVLVHDATSTAANRFLCPGSANYTLNANDSVMLWYDTTSSRWRVIAAA
jgi:hypothetical protein